MSEQQSAAIDVISQQVKALADPAATFQQIESGLGELWYAADARGDQQTKDYLQNVWQKTQELAGNNTAANNVAAAALQTAVEMAEQVVKTQQELLEVQESISDLTQEAFEEGAEYGQEAVMESILNSYNGEVYFEYPGEEVVVVLKYEIERTLPDGAKVKDPCSEDAASNFVRYLGGHTTPMGPAIAQRVAEMITEFGALYDAEIERQYNEAQAKREAFMRDLDASDRARTA